MNYKKILLPTIALVSTFMGLSDLAIAQSPCDTITPDFSSNAPRCTGSTVDFVYTQQAYGTMTYLWDFGSGASPATSTAQNPTGVVYATPGLKLVRLTVEIVIGATTCTKVKTGGVSIVETPAPAFTDNGSQCEQAEFNFNYTGTTGTGWTFDWDFGTGSNPAVSSAQNPTGVTYNGSGLKTVTLTVSNGACSGSLNQNVTVLNKPDAGFSVGSPACTGDGVSFTNTGTTGVTYAWNFGTNSTPGTSTVESPNNIVYSASGSKSIRQIVTQGSCSDTSIQSLSVTQTPAPTYTTNAPQCEGAAVNFNYTGTTGTGWTYNWDFGTGSSPSVSTAQNPLGVLYSGSGGKAVALTVTNQNCSQILNSVININVTPQSGFGTSSPACSNDSVDFSNTGTSGITYGWNFGSGSSPSTSSLENPQGIIYSSPGIKTVRQVSIQGSCSDTSFNTVNVTETPVPTFSSTSPQCEGAKVDFTYNGSTGIGWTYLWDFGTGANPSISTAQNPVGIEYTGAGTKTVTLTVTNQFCSETVMNTVTINSTPTSSFSSNAPGCTGDSINFLNTGSTGLTYNWDFGTGANPATSTNESPVGVIYSSAGTKNIRQIITQGLCVDTSYLSINLKETPAPAFTDNAPRCEGSDVNFSYTGSSGTGWTYLWDFGTGANPSVASSQTPVGVVYSGSGIKNISLTVTNSGCSKTFTDTLVIDMNPTASFSTTAPGCTGDSVFFSNTGTSGIPGLIYNWNFSSASPLTSTQEVPGGVVFSQAGPNKVEFYMVLGNCSDTTSQFVTINEKPTVSFTSNAPVCARDAVSFANLGSSGNNWNYNWDFGSGASPSSSTSENPGNIRYNSGGSKTVALSISDANCSNNDTATIQVFSLPVSSAGADTTICADKCLQLGTSQTAGYTYKWFPSSTLDNATSSNPTACPLASINTYIVTTKDANNCTSSDTIVVSMLPSAIAKAGNDVEVCIGDTVQIGAALLEGQVYSWTPSTGLNNDAISSPLASPDSTTTYQVSVSYRGCEVITDEVLVTVFQNPIVSAGDDVTIARGESAQLLATGAIMYEWSPTTGLSNAGIANPIASPDETITYLVTFTDINSCVSLDSVSVTVIEADVWAPEAFTPNDDGKNDVFYVRTNGAKSFELLVFNRSGEMIYRSTNPASGWDGTKQGSSEKASTGAYVYSAKGQLSDGSSFVRNGVVNLIR